MLALSIGLFVAVWGGFGMFAVCAVRSNLQEAEAEHAKTARIRRFLAESKARYVELHLENQRTVKGRVHEVSEDIVIIDIRKLKRGQGGLEAKDAPLPSDVESTDLQDIDHVYRYDEVEDDDEDVDAYVEEQLESGIFTDED